MSDFYDVKINVRSSVKLLPEIKGLLLVKSNHERLFRDIVFSPWLDILSHDNDSHMMHYVLQHQVLVFNFRSDSPPIIFHIGDHWLEFGQKEFCLITGFRFGNVSEKYGRMSPFFNRHFLENKTRNGFKRITGFDLLRVLRDKNTWLKMLDEDAVRLYLLIASELVFMGKEKRNFLTKHLMWLVDDFDAWNVFPWGEYMWDTFYQRAINVVSKHTEHHLAELKKNPNFNATYNLYGFVWAFKIWIMESYPNSKKWWSKKANVIPRGLALLNDKKFEKSDYDFLFGPLSNLNVALISSTEEMRQAWFMANVEYIKGLADQDGNFFQDDEARVNCIEHNNGMCGDTEVGKFMQDEEARVNGIEHHNGMCGDTEVGKFVQDEEARVNGIKHHNGMCGDTEVGKFMQDEEERVNGIEHHNGMCGDTEDGNFAEGIDETICPKSNQMSVEEGDGVLDSEGDGVHFHNDTSNHIGGLSTEAKPSSSSSNPGIDKDASHLDDFMEIDGENVKDGYTNSQDHLHLLIKVLESKTENPTLDVVVPPKDDDCILRTRKPNDAYDVVEVDNYEDDYMLILNDEEKPVKSTLNDMELKQEPDKINVKQGILEQQPNAPKGKTTVFKETVGVKVEEKHGLRRGVGPLKVKKKNCQRALRPYYLLRSAKDRKKKLAMALKPLFGQQSATTPVPKKRKSRIMKTEVNVPPFDFEDISEQLRIRSMNDIMTHEHFVENLSRPDDYKSDKVTVLEHMCEFITNKDLPEYRFPWGKRDIVIGRSFWLSLSCLNTVKAGWLNDHHLDLWIDLIWSLRPPEADWAIVSPHFSTCILSGMMSDYFSNGHMYPLPWQAVEKVYFLVNEPKTHWYLAELEIHTGVVTFYDSLGWAGGSRRRWWRRTKKLLPEKLTVYLVMHGILERKGISADDYKITYKLCRNIPLIVDDPLEIALAYRERMLEYFWSHKIPVKRTSSIV
ncbi:phospholipase-like protein [Tanacetum coccineum]